MCSWLLQVAKDNEAGGEEDGGESEAAPAFDADGLEAYLQSLAPQGHLQVPAPPSPVRPPVHTTHSSFACVVCGGGCHARAGVACGGRGHATPRAQPGRHRGVGGGGNGGGQRLSLRVTFCSYLITPVGRAPT